MSLPKYPQYRDSGVRWLGEVPEHWEVLPLKKMATLITGITPPTNDPANYVEENGFPWIRPEDIKENTNFSTASKFLSQKGEEYVRKIPAQSTLICGIGTIGKVGFITELASTNQQITAVDFHEDKRYCYYISKASAEEMNAVATGNVVRILNNEKLGAVIYPKPSIVEQTAIANFLDQETAKIDALVAEQEKLITLLKEKRQALISHAVTKGLNADAPMKDSGVPWLGEVPEHWGVFPLKKGYMVTLGKMLQPNKKNSDDELLPYLRAANIQWAKIDTSDIKQMWFSTREKMELTLMADDLLISEGGDVGRSCLWRNELPVCYFQNSINRVRSINNNSTHFLYFYMSMIKAKGYIDVLCNKATIAHFTAEKVAVVPVTQPPKEEQTAIANFLDQETGKIDALVTEAESAIALLQERRSALISAAVTGKIDVRDVPLEEVA